MTGIAPGDPSRAHGRRGWNGGAATYIGRVPQGQRRAARRSGRWSRSPWWAWVVIVVGVVFLAVCIPIASARQGKPLSQAERERLHAAAAEAEAADTAAEPSTVAFFGDSITHGTGRGREGDPRAADIAAADLGVTARVFGHPGTGYVNDGSVYSADAEGASFPEQLPKDLTGTSFDALIIQGSSNDQSVDVTSGELGAAIDETIGAARQALPRATIVLMGPYTTDPDNRMTRERDALAAAAERRGLSFIDPVSLGWLQGRPELIDPDGYHPNSAGHEQLGHLWAEALRGVLPAELLGDVDHQS